MDDNFDGDFVVRELDVYVVNELELYLLQLPLKPSFIEPPEFHAAKFKPRHCRLELEGGTTVPKLSSSTVTPSTCLAVGVVKDNKLNITPLKQVLQLRPPFNNLAARGEVLENADDDTVDVKVKPRLEQVQMKRKDDEKSQMSRRQDYSDMKAREESEIWQRLRVHKINSDESNQMFESMYFDKISSTDMVVSEP